MGRDPFHILPNIVTHFHLPKIWIVPFVLQFITTMTLVSKFRFKNTHVVDFEVGPGQNYAIFFHYIENLEKMYFQFHQLVANSLQAATIIITRQLICGLYIYLPHIWYALGGDLLHT